MHALSARVLVVRVYDVLPRTPAAWPVAQNTFFLISMANAILSSLCGLKRHASLNIYNVMHSITDENDYSNVISVAKERVQISGSDRLRSSSYIWWPIQFCMGG